MLEFKVVELNEDGTEKEPVVFTILKELDYYLLFNDMNDCFGYGDTYGAALDMYIADLEMEN